MTPWRELPPHMTVQLESWSKSTEWRPEWLVHLIDYYFLLPQNSRIQRPPVKFRIFSLPTIGELQNTFYDSTIPVTFNLNQAADFFCKRDLHALILLSTQKHDFPFAYLKWTCCWSAEKSGEFQLFGLKSNKEFCVYTENALWTDVGG